MSLLELKNVDISYGKNLTVKNCSLSLEKGEICSIVGESGSGKTTVIRAIMGLLPGGGRVSAGSITYDGTDLLNLTDEEWRGLRGLDVSMIFQDSGTMMNQTRLIGDSYVEYILTHEKLSRKAAWAKGIEMIELLTGSSPTLATYSLVRKGEGLPIERRIGFTYQHMAYLFKTKKIEPIMVHAPFEPDQSKPIAMSVHEGQEMDFIVKGKMKFVINNNTEILNEGDCVDFDSSNPHGMIAIEGDCDFLAILI